MSPSKEYLFLFNIVSAAATDMQDLQAWVAIQSNIAKSLLTMNEQDKAVTVLRRIADGLESRLQEEQLLFIEAQRRAEEIYLAGGD